MWQTVCSYPRQVLQDVIGILLLGWEEAHGRSSYADAKVGMERALVLHDELTGELGDIKSEKRRTWGGEDDVVDIQQQVHNIVAVVDEQQGLEVCCGWGWAF